MFSTSVSVRVLKYSGAAQGFAGAGTFRVNASYRTYRNTIVATTDIMLPTELTRFQPARPSG